MRLSFAPKIAKEMSLQLLKEHFDVASVTYTPEELTFPNWSVDVGGNLAFRAGDDSVTFKGFHDGRVQGEIRGHIKHAVGYRQDCLNSDAPAPPGCSVSSEVHIPLLIAFDLPLPTGPMNCIGPNAPRTCGT